jgi:DNA-binding transcriptional ArsR family regulator
VLAYEATLDALADPNRRAVLHLLRDSPRSVQELADVLPISRPAVSQHLRVLRDAKLVVDRPEGTKRIYSVDPTGLTALQAYLEGVWTEAMASFAQSTRDAGS